MHRETTSALTVQGFKIEATADDHVFIIIEREGRPTISLDLSNGHGRGGLSVRAGGMGIASVLVDVEPLGPAGAVPYHRYCPWCGEKINLVSSISHRCEVSEGER